MTKESNNNAKKPTRCRNERYLRRLPSGSWEIRFDVPAALGGGHVRVVTHTTDKLVAMGLRDRYVTPLLVECDALNVLRKIEDHIVAAQKGIADAIPMLKARIEGGAGALMTLGQGLEYYGSYLKKSSALRPRSISKFLDSVRRMCSIVGDGKAVEMLSRQDGALMRDKLVADGKSSATIFGHFSACRTFLKRLYRDGKVSRDCSDALAVDLPAVRKENTAIIPPDKADDAAWCMGKEWILPSILRYTGMRIGEAEACIAGREGCGIVVEQGFMCFSISAELCKTHTARLVPVSDRLAAIMTTKSLKKASSMCGDGTHEPYCHKRYNVLLKRIPGCEKCHVHSWRVYAQTMMAEAGIDDGIVRRIVGHTGDVHAGYTAGRIEAMKKALDTIP